MKRIRQILRTVLRGPEASRLLERLGIDPRRYWLLMDLFGELSERGEVMDQLGRNGVALETAGWLYAAVSALMAIAMIVSRTAPAAYLSAFLGLTGFLLLFILLSEAGNSLVNPEEGLILAHQPINGATYTAAKLSHLARIVFTLAPAMNVVPALGSLLLPRAPWYFPLFEMTCALAVGLVAALLSCALYGWLIRLLPAKRLRAAAQTAGALPFLSFMLWGPLERLFKRAAIADRLPTGPAAQWGMAAAAGIIAITAVAFGIRSLSADYLLRVTGIMHGARRKTRARRSRLFETAAALAGGQAGRAGWAFVSRMARRDFQFRRQALPMLIILAFSFVPLVARGWRTDPFSRRFTTMHLAPHLFGFVLFFVCSLLKYGAEYKGRWIFQLAPARSVAGFARGVYAALYVPCIAVPHILLLPALVWAWGFWNAGLFVCFSLAVSSIYLALEIRLVDAVPFTRQMVATGSAAMMGILMVGAVAIAVAVGIQYFVIFHSPATAAASAVVLGGVAWMATRQAVRGFAEAMRYDLATVSGEAGTLYREVGA